MKEIITDKDANIGDIKQEIEISIIPRIVEGKLIWFKKHLVTYEYKSRVGYSYEMVSSGLIDDYYSKTLTYFQEWVVVKRELILKQQ